MLSEILDRIAALAEEMHTDVNGDVGRYATRGELKRTIRHYRDRLRELVAEAGR